jgi:hypothetical protein|tara:strand:- start:91 stop:369 length:279 start_codon:yes stop_codon:yes gene_type:complete
VNAKLGTGKRRELRKAWRNTLKPGDLVKIENDLLSWRGETYGVIIEIIGIRDSPMAVAQVLLSDGTVQPAYLRNCRVDFLREGERGVNDETR